MVVRSTEMLLFVVPREVRENGLHISREIYFPTAKASHSPLLPLVIIPSNVSMTGGGEIKLFLYSAYSTLAHVKSGLSWSKKLIFSGFRKKCNEICNENASSSSP